MKPEAPKPGHNSDPATQPEEVKTPAHQATVPAPPPEPERVLYTWNAPEFTYTQKPAGWYGILALFFIVLIVVAVLTHQWLSIAVFAVMGVAVAVIASRKPRNLNYSVTNYGLHVGDKSYEYAQFSSYFEADDYGKRVLELVPIQRFAPLVSLPMPDSEQDQIEQNLAQVLPKSPPRTSFIERLFKAFRF